MTLTIEDQVRTWTFQPLPVGTSFEELYKEADENRLKMSLTYKTDLHRQSRLEPNRPGDYSSGYCDLDSGRVTMTLSDWKQNEVRNTESDPNGVFLTLNLPINPNLSLETIAPIQMSLSLSNEGHEIFHETDLAQCEGQAIRSSDRIQVKIDCKEDDLHFEASCLPVGH
jgi:hypothetical protein